MTARPTAMVAVVAALKQSQKVHATWNETAAAAIAAMFDNLPREDPETQLDAAISAARAAALGSAKGDA